MGTSTSSNCANRSRIARGLLAAALAFPLGVMAQESDWSMGVYAGKYYDTEPAGFTQGRANFLEHYLVALTAKKTLWQSASLPLALELDGMVGIQGGIADNKNWFLCLGDMLCKHAGEISIGAT